MTADATIARTATPGPGIHFRKCAFGSAGVPDFLRAVIALANAEVEGPRYILVGVEIPRTGRRHYHDVPEADFEGNPAYTRLVDEFIEPAVRLRYRSVAVNDHRVGIFEISNCYDKPYMMRIDHSERLRRGDAYVQVNNRPVKLGRCQLQALFASRFRDAVSADQIEVGFAGEITHKEMRFPTVDLDELPSVVARRKLQQLVKILAGSKGTGSTSMMARLTHVRLFGADSPYQNKTAEELLSEMERTAVTHCNDDQYYLFETHASKLQLVVFNHGSEPLEHASLSLCLPQHDDLFIAERLPPVPKRGCYVDRDGLEAESYPSVLVSDDSVRVSIILGDIPGGAPVQAFESPLRVAAGPTLRNRRVGLRYSLSAGNLRLPATGKLRLMF